MHWCGGASGESGVGMVMAVCVLLAWTSEGTRLRIKYGLVPMP